MNDNPPLLTIHSSAPARICDLGGWTDTWFARFGRVLNIGVAPNVEVRVRVFPARSAEARVEVFAENFSQRFVVHPGLSPDTCRQQPHPLLQATISAVGVPGEFDLDIHICSSMPSGAATGTSAAVTVALAAALDRLRGGSLAPGELALLAQQVETRWLEQQCGIQDQLCSAYGGILLIEMDEYPHAMVTVLPLDENHLKELQSRLVLVYLGKSHSSSKIHDMVIRQLENTGPQAPQLQALREIVPPASQALLRADWAEFGGWMIANNEAQRRLHPLLISPEAEQVIDIARRYGALGWKVNGAGGDGGSLTILDNGDMERRSAMLAEMQGENPLLRMIPVRLNPQGVRVEKVNHAPAPRDSAGL